MRVLFVQKFSEASKNGYDIDAFELFSNFTLDSIGEIAFGANIDSMNNLDTPFAKAFNK